MPYARVRSEQKKGDRVIDGELFRILSIYIPKGKVLSSVALVVFVAALPAPLSAAAVASAAAAVG